MFIRISLLAFAITFILSLCYLSYELGKRKAQVKIITQQVEVIKYIDRKKSTIYSQPNATKEELLKLMRANIL